MCTVKNDDNILSTIFKNHKVICYTIKDFNTGKIGLNIRNTSFYMQRKLIVVEGSKGKTVAFSTPEINDVVFDTVTRKSSDKWTEQLEIWIPVPSKEQEPFNAGFTNRTATDRNGEISFQACFKAKYQNCYCQFLSSVF